MKKAKQKNFVNFLLKKDLFNKIVIFSRDELKQYEMKNTNHASKQLKNILDLHLVYRYHLGYHIGKISSFQIRNQMKYRNKHGLERVSHRCFEQSTSWIEKSSILYKQLG